MQDQNYWRDRLFIDFGLSAPPLHITWDDYYNRVNDFINTVNNNIILFPIDFIENNEQIISPQIISELIDKGSDQGEILWALLQTDRTDLINYYINNYGFSNLPLTISILKDATDELPDNDTTMNWIYNLLINNRSINTVINIANQLGFSQLLIYLNHSNY